MKRKRGDTRSTKKKKSHSTEIATAKFVNNQFKLSSSILPEEVLVKVFSHLHLPKYVSSASLVNRTWNRLSPFGAENSNFSKSFSRRTTLEETLFRVEYDH